MTSAAPSSPGTAAGREDLCRRHLALVGYEVRALAARVPQHVNRDELTSAGMAALASAATTFDPSRGVPFDRFAARRIKGALLDELRSADWASRSVRRRARARDVAHDDLCLRLGRPPSAVELAAALCTGTAEMDGLAADVHRSLLLSVERLAEAGVVEALLPYVDETPESVLVERERRSYLLAAVEVLPDRLKQVVVGHFLQERPLKDIARDLGVTESRASQLRAEALRLLKDGLNAQLAPDLVAEPENPLVARRRARYYAAVAAQSTYRARLSQLPDSPPVGAVLPVPA